MSTKKRAIGAKVKQRNSAKAGDSKRGSNAKKSTASKPPANLKPATPARKWGTSASQKTGSRAKSGKMDVIRKNVKDISATIGSMVPRGSPEQVAAVAGGALLAGATLGAGPAALAGAAGYLAYKGLSGSKKKRSGAGSATRKRKA